MGAFGRNAAPYLKEYGKRQAAGDSPPAACLLNAEIKRLYLHEKWVRKYFVWGDTSPKLPQAFPAETSFPPVDRTAGTPILSARVAIPARYKVFDLSLNGADHNAFNKKLLAEREDHKNGHDDRNGKCIVQRFGRRSVIEHFPLRLRKRGIQPVARHGFAQDQLDGIHALLIQVQKRRKPGIP